MTAQNLIKQSQPKYQIDDINAFYERETHKIIHKIIELNNLQNYEVTPFAIECISGFLLEYDYHGSNLSAQHWVTVIKMYMGLIEIDYGFLDGIYASMQVRN